MLYRIDESDNIARATVIPRRALISGEKLELRRSTSRPDVPSGATEVIGNNLYQDGSDVDLYGVRLSQGDELLIDVDARNNDGRRNANGRLDRISTLESVIRVFDANGNPIPGAGARANQRTEPDSNESSRDPALLFTANLPGINTYYIGVSARGNNSYNATIADKNAPGSGKIVPTGNPNREGAFQLELTLVNAQLPQFSISDAPEIIEGTGGSQFAIFTVSMDRASTRSHSINYATADGTAIAGQDYLGVSESLTFKPDVTSLKTKPIPIITDNIVELKENFFVNLFNPTGGATIADSQGIGPIVDDDSAVITIDDVEVVEGNSGQTKAIFTVDLSQPVDTEVKVDFEAVEDRAAAFENRATAGIDFTNLTSNVTFAPHQISSKIEVDIHGDTWVERNETFWVNLLPNLKADGRTVTLDDSQGIGTIINDDLATISISDVTLVEGNSGTTTFDFEVSIDNPASEDITLIANTNELTATGSGIDFSDFTDQVVTIHQGSTSARVIVDVVGETLAESDETFEVVLSDPKIGGVADLSRVAIGKSQGLGKIINDDPFEIDLSITKTDGVDKVLLGNHLNGSLTYTIEVANNSLFAVNDIVVEDVFPTELTNITWSGVGTGGASGFETILQTGNLIDDGISLAPGASITYTVNAFVNPNTAGGTIVTNTANVISNNPLAIDTNPSNNSATDTTLVISCIRGTNGQDMLVGTHEDECIEGLEDDDTIAGGLGNDFLFGNEGDDILRGDRNSRSSGGRKGGNDVIYGGTGNDRIGGKAGDDRLFGDEGDDQIWGDDGDDLLRGGLGNDLLTGDDTSGGRGSDTFIVAVGEGTDTIADFELGEDLIGLADGLSFGQLAIAQQGDDTAIGVGSETLAILNNVDTQALIAAANTTFVLV